MKSSLDRPHGVGLSGFLLGCASLLLLPVFGADALPTRDIAIRFQSTWGDSPVHLNQFHLRLYKLNRLIDIFLANR